MAQNIKIIFFGSFIFIQALCAEATDRYFSDIVADSPNKQFQVTAKSPDNKGGKGAREAFQSNFVYQCKDLKSGKTLWARKQNSDKEGAPTSIFISNSGWTVIRTDFDELVVVDLQGRDRGRINLLEDAFTKEERPKYVHDTTAGPRWSGFSLWYFLDIGKQHFFVVRPWWGRRIIIDIANGKLIKENEKISNAAFAYEKDFVLKELEKGVQTRKEWDKFECCSEAQPVVDAAYLAGRLRVVEAIPSLRALETAEFSGMHSSSFGGEGTYYVMTVRQIAQLSLRRLGEKPQGFPANVFDFQWYDYKKNRPNAPQSFKGLRYANAEKIMKGMKSKQVLELVGNPDFIGSEWVGSKVENDRWEYDMDGETPFTLVVKLSKGWVVGAEKKTPPLWQEGFIRDEQIVG